ncbi:MAG: potassium transporter Kef [Gammaproteobacteria bacterium]|nr:MAG: potassium transporter Kef [Gammaproteobacteria bacterium]
MQADIIAITVAFLFGFGARMVSLPPLVGYLIAGFVLYSTGMEASVTLKEFAEIGVTLLLFSIGLKLRLDSLLMPQIWGVASAHMAIIVALASLFIYLLSLAGFAMFTGLDLNQVLLIAFALSFSSTVFAVKILEDKGEMASLYGRISIGILIMQDIAAVIFLAASTGKVPSIWALLLLGLIPLRPVLHKMLEKSGHGELQVLFGLTLALGGAQIFELVSVKGDLGALILGIMLASHVRASELARQLLGFKDLFLVGFFLTIGMSGPLQLDALWIALVLLILVPFKTALFFALLSVFRLRARTSLLTSLSLANYSEFGLIVAAIAVSNGWIGSEWLLIIAIALSFTFILAAPLNATSYAIYSHLQQRLVRFQSPHRIEEEKPFDLTGAEVVILGMGRVGTGAYDSIHKHMGDVVLGVDYDDLTVEVHRKEGRWVESASAVDPDHWERVELGSGQIKLILLAMPKFEENLFATQQLKAKGYSGKIAAIAKYADEITSLQEAGVDRAYNLYAEAGTGFADDVCNQLMPDCAT